ncbi:MAG: type 4a pilus biogenesis protein PilO [Planctomycetota bacterium]
MIVCRRPYTLYDVDLIGLAALAAIGAAAWFLVVAPWGDTWNRYRGLLTRRAAVETQLQHDLADLQRFEADLARIQRAAAEQTGRVPTAASVAQLLRQVTDLAQGAELELLSVAPQAMQRDGPYLVHEIQLAGRGRSRDFFLYLDRLAREIPYQSLQNCSISRAATSAEPTCDLAWSLRLYLLPEAPAPATGGSSS